MDWAAYLSLFGSSFLSATILPAASEGVMGYMIYKEFNPVLCVLIATLGNTLGGATNYFIGKLGNWSILEKYMGVKQERIDSFKKYADRYGSLTALMAWVPFIGDPLIIALGFFRVNFYMVLFWMTIGKFLRYLVIALSIQYF